MKTVDCTRKYIEILQHCTEKRCTSDTVALSDIMIYSMVVAGLNSVANVGVDSLLHKITPIIFKEWSDVVKGPRSTVDTSLLHRARSASRCVS